MPLSGRDLCRPNLRFMIKILNQQLVIPDFVTFRSGPLPHVLPGDIVCLLHTVD